MQQELFDSEQALIEQNRQIKTRLRLMEQEVNDLRRRALKAKLVIYDKDGNLIKNSKVAPTPSISDTSLRTPSPITEDSFSGALFAAGFQILPTPEEEFDNNELDSTWGQWDVIG